MADLKKVRAAAASRSKKPSKNWQLQYGLWAGGVAGSIVIACVAILFSPGRGLLQSPVNDSNLITHINLNAKTWRAGPVSFFEGWTIGDVKTLSGIAVSNQVGGISECSVQAVDLPPSFDSRERWRQCFNHPVYNMGNCSSSWAIATASAMSNRFCIASPAENAGLRLSPQQLLSCDKHPNSRGCSGGMLDTAWAFMKQEGLVSETCFPYQADSGVACESICSKKESRRIASVCRLSSEENMRREIFLNGPVVAPIMLMNDFLTYRGGIYQETSTASQLVNADRQRQMHAVKFIGWGSEGGRNYFIIENSWGQDWGENGFGRIFSGSSPKKESIFLQEFTFAGTPASSKVGSEFEDDSEDGPSDEGDDP